MMNRKTAEEGRALLTKYATAAQKLEATPTASRHLLEAAFTKRSAQRDIEDWLLKNCVALVDCALAATEPHSADCGRDDAKDAARYRALRYRIRAGETVGDRDRCPKFLLPLFLDEYAKRYDLFKGSVAGHLDDALDHQIDYTPHRACGEIPNTCTHPVLTSSPTTANRCTTCGAAVPFPQSREGGSHG